MSVMHKIPLQILDFNNKASKVEAIIYFLMELTLISEIPPKIFI